MYKAPLGTVGDKKSLIHSASTYRIFMHVDFVVYIVVHGYLDI